MTREQAESFVASVLDRMDHESIQEAAGRLLTLLVPVFHDVDQYYPKDMSASDAAKILLDAERTKDEEVCQECGKNPPDHKGICEGCLAYRDHTAI